MTGVDWRDRLVDKNGPLFLRELRGHTYAPGRPAVGDGWQKLLEILSLELPSTSAPALAMLIEQARMWAEQSPFDLKDTLKRRGYRWSDGNDGRPRSWYIDVEESAVAEEIAFLKSEIYLRDVEPRLQTLTAFTRFSVRA
jgi:DNA polymerase III subunit epsilon